MNIASLTQVAHRIAGAHLEPGDTAVDGTAGNGNDTLRLADAVGPTGRVYAFDLQADALHRTGNALERHHLRDRVTLVHAGHQEMTRHLPTEVHGRVRIALFNLGYLPGGNPTVITTARTTVPALTEALALLSPRGLLLVTCYPAHSGGGGETQAVVRWAASLRPDRASAIEYRPLNRTPTTPRLLMIQKL